MPQSSDIGQNSDRGISDFQISGQSFLKENYHNSGNSNDSDVKRGPVFGFMAILEHLGCRCSLDVQSVKLTFSVTVTFCLAKTENRTRESPTQLSF